MLRSTKRLTATAKGDEGFTLIELLVVVIIIGVLVGIAIPALLHHRERANQATVQSDVRNMQSEITLQIASTRSVPEGTYTKDEPLVGPSSGFIPSTNVTLVVNGGLGAYTITGTHAYLGGYSYTYDAGAGEYAESGG